MKISLLLTAFFVFAIVLPTMAQLPEETPHKAHETVIDGRWEAKLTTHDPPVALFEFKNATGTVSGTITQNGNPTPIKNGNLEGTSLKFETTQVPAGGGDPIMMTWTGIVSGDGQSIQLTSVPMTSQSPRGSRVQSQQMEARRVE